MVIFLDIDGVLNQLQGNYYLDENCVRLLAELCKNLNGKVVLTSSWRLGYTRIGTCSPQIEKLKHLFDKYNISLIGRTFDLGSRDVEIRDYIIRHSISDYIIIDDDISEFKDRNFRNLFFVSSRKGLTSKDLDRIINNIK